MLDRLMPRRWIPYLLALTLCWVGCPGSYEDRVDGASGTEDGQQWQWDTGGGKQDGPQKYDQPQTKWDTGGGKKDTAMPWPDTMQPDWMPHGDLYPWPPDQGGYTPSPFGCQLDGDCYGLRCCPTPWGVKLCATVCQY